MNLSVSPWRYEFYFVLQYEQHISEGKLQGCTYVFSPSSNFILLLYTIAMHSVSSLGTVDKSEEQTTVGISILLFWNCRVNSRNATISHLPSWKS